MTGQIDDRILESLNTAFNAEIKGRDFYRAASELIDDERGKNIFKHLAEEELEHIKVISRIAESVKAGTRWLSYEKALESSSVDEESIFLEKNELVERLRENPTDINAITIAMENEERAVDFYFNLLKEASVPEEKVVLSRLLEMEKGHLKLLRWERESLVNTGFWCDMIEFSVEKELE